MAAKRPYRQLRQYLSRINFICQNLSFWIFKLLNSLKYNCGAYTGWDLTIGDFVKSPLRILGTSGIWIYFTFSLILLELLRNQIKQRLRRFSTCKNVLLNIFCSLFFLPLFLPLIAPLVSYGLVRVLPENVFSKDNWLRNYNH